MNILFFRLKYLALVIGKLHVSIKMQNSKEDKCAHWERGAVS